MIESFTIKNFLSISETEIRMTYDEGRAPAGYKERSDWTFFEPQGTKSRVVPCLALYGPNASGKTTLIRAFACLCNLVCDNDIDYLPNKLIKSGEATEFSLVFYVPEESEFSKEASEKSEQKTYHYKKAVYSVSFNKAILSERLEYDGKELFFVEEGKIVYESVSISIEYTSERLGKIFQVECTKDGKQYRSFLNCLAKNYPGLNNHIKDAFFCLANIPVFPENQFHLAYSIEVLRRLQGAKRQPEEIFQDIAAILQKLDIDIKKISLERKEYDPAQTQVGDTLIKNGNFIKFFDRIRSYHVSDSGEMVEFNFEKEESEGTKIVAGVLGICLAAMESGGVLIIDEMDRSIHPLVFIEIVRLLKDKEYNTNQAQFIFTTHCTDLLDSGVIGKSEICIVDKTPSKGTFTRRVSEYEDVKNLTQLREKYLQGSFWGIPFPYI